MSTHGTTDVAVTQLHLQASHTVLAAARVPSVVVAVGAQDLALKLFHHSPPTPAELEHAIDRVEDALAATGLRHAERGALHTEDARLHALLGLHSSGDAVTRDEVEARFQALAFASLAHAAARQGVLSGDDAAALLILRECMHHLGYASIVRAGV